MGMASLGNGAWITPAGMTVTAAGAAYAAIRRHVARKAVRTAWAGGTALPARPHASPRRTVDDRRRIPPAKPHAPERIPPSDGA